jgi:diacylglycerol kinase (ATP)
MREFGSIFVIYNPNSTGDSQGDAKELKAKLAEVLSDITVVCIPTKYAGHAEELAREIAESHPSPLIVSSSGDGGYNEVINGVMGAGEKAKSPICAVLSAGNANDHSRTMQDRPLWQAIAEGSATKIDLLKVIVSADKSADTVRYAHSYAGLGLTPVMAVELNRHTLNAFKEMKLVLKTFFKYRPFKIRHEGKVLTLDSLMFMNINQMAKVLTLAEENKPDDGMFEMVAFPHGRKLLLIQQLLKAATVGLKTVKREKEYTFEVVRDMPMQLDGEVTNIKAGSRVRVISEPEALSTIV